jgi:PAS domain S-box-containing protein
MTNRSFDSNHLEAIIKTINDAVITANQEGKIIFWNQAAQSMFQYSENEVVGKSLTQIIPDRFREAHEAGIKRVSGGGQHHVIGTTVELWGKRKDGSEFPIELSLSTWKTGEESFFGGIIRDITARKNSEKALKEAEIKFRSIAESANDAIISADSKGKVISWNNAAENMFGYSEADIIHQSLMLIIPERFRILHEKGIDRINQGGSRHVIGNTVELTGLHKEGHEFPIELSLSTWNVAGENFFCGIIRDITKRKEIEKALKEAEIRFRSIAESANDAIISADSKGNIISWNKAAENMFGYSEVDIIHQSLTLIIPERFRILHEKGIERVNQGGSRHVIGKTVELTGLHKDGHEFPLELSLSTWNVGGENFFCGIIRDISERKKAEEDLNISRKKLAEKAGKLRTANKEIKIKNEQLQALSNKLAKYLSQQVYKSIFSGKKDVKIESYRKNLTVFFSDIHGFTELTDRVESEVLTTVLNKYLNEMSKIALEFGGTIDKFIGDAIMIFFGDPESLGEKQDAIACVKMAIKMREKLEELRIEWDSLGMMKPLQVRMGINSGFCTVGNFGSEDRLDYTIVGSTVNIASRLESAARVNQILISHNTYSLIKDEIQCEMKEELKLKGQAYPIQTYEVINTITRMKTEEEKLKTELEGFNIVIDFKKLNYSNRLLAKEIMEKAISKLK